MGEKRPLIAVFGSSTITEASPQYALAHALGRALARVGADVMTGGYGGAMAACSRGAHEEGARVVGVTVEIFEKRGPVNRWVTERVHTPDLFERLRYIIHHADGFVALPGSIGTLTEVLLAWTLLSVRGRPEAPLVLLGSHWDGWLAAHRHPDIVIPHLFEYVQTATSPEAAAHLVLTAAAARGTRRG